MFLGFKFKFLLTVNIYTLFTLFLSSLTYLFDKQKFTQ